MNNEAINALLEECERNQRIQEYEELERQEIELEERLQTEALILTQEQEQELQNKLEATKNEIQVLEQKMTPEEKNLLEERKNLIDDCKSNIEFIAASLVIPENDDAGTTSLIGMINKEEFVKCFTPYYQNLNLLEEVGKDVSDEVLGRLCEYASHPEIEGALQAAPVTEVSEANAIANSVMEKKGINPETEHIYEQVTERFSIYATNGLLKEIAPETEISKSQLLNLAATMIRTDNENNPYTSADIASVYRSGLHQENQVLTSEQQEQIDYITVVFLSEKLKGKSQDEVNKECKEWGLSEEQKNAVVEAVVKGDEVQIGKYDYHTGELDESPLTSAQLQQAEKAVGEEIDPKNNTRVDKPKSHKGAEGREL